ncbi:MAG: hypothetical protein ACREVA_12930 [Burkholderiales bacterium]
MNNATIGFEDLAAEINKPSKSLHRMLAPHGNPNKFLRHRESITEKDARKASRDGQSGLTCRIAHGATMAQIGVSETEALERGMEEKAVEFRQACAEVYRKF